MCVTYPIQVADSVIWCGTERGIDVQELIANDVKRLVAQYRCLLRSKDHLDVLTYERICRLEAQFFPQELDDCLESVEGSNAEVVVLLEAD